MGRPSVFTLLVLGVLGCQGHRGGGVARVGAETLTADRLASLMVLAQPLPLTPGSAYELASHWVTLTAFAGRAAAGDSLLDSAAILDFMAERIRQEVVAEWRGRLLARIPVARQARFDSTYAQDLLRAKQARLTEGAPATLRTIATDPWQPGDSGRAIATFTGGLLGAGQLQRYVQYLTPATRREMREAPDARITDFLWGFLLQELLWRQADSAGVRLSASAYGAMRDECREVVHTLWATTGLSPAALATRGANPAERARGAARRTEEYLEAAAARKVPLQPVPPFVAVPLLRAVDWEIAEDQMSVVVDRAKRLLAAADARKP